MLSVAVCSVEIRQGQLRQGRFGLFRQGSVRFVALWFCMVSFGRYGVACHGELSSVSVVFVKASLGLAGEVSCDLALRCMVMCV